MGKTCAVGNFYLCLGDFRVMIGVEQSNCSAKRRNAFFVLSWSLAYHTIGVSSFVRVCKAILMVAMLQPRDIIVTY